MLLDRIKQRREAIRQIGAEAAERAAALGIQPANAVHPKPENRPLTGRMMKRVDVLPSINMTKHIHTIIKDNKR